MSIIFAYVPSAYKAGTTYTAIPNDGTADFSFSRPAAADRTDEGGGTESMAINVPRIDYSSEGCPVLLIDSSITERCYSATVNFSPNSFVWGIEIAAGADDGSGVRSVMLRDNTNSLVSFSYTATVGQTLLTYNNSGTEFTLAYNNSDITILKDIKTVKDSGTIMLKIDNVIVGVLNGVTDLPNMLAIDYSKSNTSEYFDGKTRNNIVDSEAATFNSTAKSWSEVVSLTSNSYTQR